MQERVRRGSLPMDKHSVDLWLITMKQVKRNADCMHFSNEHPPPTPLGRPERGSRWYHETGMKNHWGIRIFLRAKQPLRYESSSIQRKDIALQVGNACLVIRRDLSNVSNNFTSAKPANSKGEVPSHVSIQCSQDQRHFAGSNELIP